MPVSIAKRTFEEAKASDVKQHWWLGLKRNADETDEDDNSLTMDENVIPERDALRYFIHRGGREEDWGSQESRRTRYVL
jgi:hypothetical protein